MIFEHYKNINIFSLGYKQKNLFLRKKLYQLINYHIKKSPIYSKMIKNTSINISLKTKVEDYPFIPVRLFKSYDLMSISKDKIFKKLTSSGTSGSVSKIYLDKFNAKNQISVLNQITSDFIGNKRLPLLVIDNENIKSSNSFSARKAALLGFSVFAKNLTYILDENLDLDKKKLLNFINKNKNQNFLIFGFTYLVWDKFYKPIKKLNINLDLSKGILIHGGGWKKLIEKKVDNSIFKKHLFRLLKIKNVLNYYGMIEQTGSIFFECKNGFLHTSIYSEIFIRNQNYEICPLNTKGLIQIISLVPTSYPGNSILTEDIGELKGIDDCKCGRKGKYFLVHGRIENAELRGCSDVNK